MNQVFCPIISLAGLLLLRCQKGRDTCMAGISLILYCTLHIYVLYFTYFIVISGNLPVPKIVVISGNLPMQKIVLV